VQVSFVGAGPGDVDLITIKGAECLRKADVIIYAGSLVNPELLRLAKPGAAVHNSAGMTLDEVLETTRQAVAQGLYVVRLHTGDPSLYGAVREQMDRLDASGITYEMIPGVSSFTAAAAAVRKEFTLPDVSQTVIITRQEGRTDVPEREKLSSLAAHGASMCIFLSVQMLGKVVEELLAGGAYTASTPVTVVKKASWPDEKVYEGTLGTIEEIMKDAEVSRTAMIMVGNFLGNDYKESRLYASDYSHAFRAAKQ
jgi:precorrin-4/cobalt-precorrin-4 C11-methyltransferase